jgi:acetyl-CoA decarbonylase/synthase complex subunit gamma
LILPQLCANGVKARNVEEGTGWQVRWGPTQAADIPAYIARDCRKTDAMRRVEFPLADRLEMSIVMWLFWGIALAVILLVARPTLMVPTLASSLVLFLVTGTLWPWIPGYQGSVKGILLAAASVIAMVVASAAWLHLPPRTLLNWCIGVSAMALFVGADFQGADPRRRGGEAEQFPLILPLELVLVAAYFLVPRFAGW